MMKRIVVGLGAAAVMLALTPVAAAQTVDELVAKNLATKGGPEKWKSIQTQKLTGVAVVQGLELAVTIYGKRPNLARQELTLEIPGQPTVQIVNLFDGVKAWMINPMTGSDAPQEMTGPEAETTRDQSDFDGSLIDYRAKGHTVELLGQVAVAGKQAHHLKVTRRDLPAQHFYLDPDTGVELKIAFEGPNASETELSDYRSVDGIMVPHLMKISQGGTVQAELRILTAEFNVPIDDTLFKVK